MLSHIINDNGDRGKIGKAIKKSTLKLQPLLSNPCLFVVSRIMIFCNNNKELYYLELLSPFI